MTVRSVKQTSSSPAPDPDKAHAVFASVQHVGSVARQRSDVLQHAPSLSRDELIRTACELAQLAEYLNQISASRNQFFSKVAHELRTPLTIAKGWIGMLCYGELLPGQERIVRVVEQQIDDLTRLVNDLLDLSRHEANALELRLECVDLVSLVHQVAEHQRELTSLKGIQLIVAVQTQQAYAYVDRGRIAQVLNNLITNACRYVPHYDKGRIELIVKSHDTTVQVSVRDNGVGIAPEDLPRIFEPFYQIAGRQRGKSGLGLTIAQELIRAHGGSLTVDSTPGKGSTFHIWLRQVEPASSSTIQSKEAGM
ncbi:sensor histidine kinase [Roseiflexus sp.]|uniref:sensor histidine kinase n=1 Tax=Roseiflexus sp. TaxID=2562120 RepID=UPI00398B0B73